MCAIVASFNRDKLLELIELNSYRGSHSYSFTTYDSVNGLRIHARELGTINPDIIEIPNNGYGIVHVQAPTTEAKEAGNIHPAMENNTRLWHNGIIKANYVKQLQERYGQDIEWDTELLLRSINRSVSELRLMDGSFSCLYYDGFGAYLFRNDISPMFYDDKLNLSSTKFTGSVETPSECILEIDFNHKRLNKTGFSFKTVNNPYYFGAE